MTLLLIWKWELAVAYQEYDEPCEVVSQTDYYGTLDAMSVLTKQKIFLL